MTRKTCRRCGDDKPLKDFGKHPTAKGGRIHRCKDCVNETKRQYRERLRSQVAS